MGAKIPRPSVSGFLPPPWTSWWVNCAIPTAHVVSLYNQLALLSKSNGGLTHLPLVPHICVGDLGQHWFQKWLVAYSAPSHYLNQCCDIVNWTLSSKLQWNLNRNSDILIHENAFQNIVCTSGGHFVQGAYELTKPLMKLGHGWVITSHCFMRGNIEKHSMTYHKYHRVTAI